MSAPTTAVAKPTNELAAQAQAIDRIATEAMALFEGAGGFEQELAVAQSIKELRAALTPKIMEPVMELMNTDLGFLTDKDPRRPAYNKTTRQYETPKPYSVEIIRDVLIESKLRGFHTVGNEFNVISGRFYAAKNGLKRRCETWPGVTDLKIVIGIPKTREGGAIVPVLGTWKKDRIADKIETEIAVRVNEFMGADAIVGKAERKLYKRIFDRLSGRVTPDGEVDDVKELAPADAPKLTAPPPGNAPAATTAPAPAPTQKAPPAPPPSSAPPRRAPTLVEEPLNENEKAESASGLAPTEEPGGSAGPALSAAQTQLLSLLTAAGFTFQDLLKAGPEMIGAGNKMSGIVAWDTYSGIEEFPDKAAEFFIKARAGMLEQLRAMKGTA